MDIERFKSKYGIAARHNGASVSVIPTKSESKGFRHFAVDPEYTGTELFTILMSEAVTWRDNFVINRKSYLVFSIKTIWKGDDIAYNEIILFENDFTHAMTVQKQARGLSGVNLAILDTNTTAFNARISSVTETQRLQLSLHNDKPTTHTVTAVYTSSVATIQVEDMVKSGGKSYEVLGIEDVNNAHRLIKLSVIEVLSA